MTDELIRKSDALALFKLPYQLLAKFEVEALPAVTVAVKPLVWESDGPDALTAQDYRIVADGHWFRCFGPHEIRKRPEYYPWPTLDAAKAAAQQDYEARILAALEPVDAPKTVVMETPPVRYCPICDIADCATHREPVAAPEPAAIREAALREAAALMAVAAENCRKQFTYPPKTKEQRDYQTGAIIHSNAAAAILALIQKGADHE